MVDSSGLDGRVRPVIGVGREVTYGDEDEWPVIVGDRDGFFSSDDLLNGWREYYTEYSDAPDVCCCTADMFCDMLMDTMIRDMMVTRETIYCSGVLEPERVLDLFEERTADGAMGMVLGMEIFIDEEYIEHNQCLLYEAGENAVEQSVLIEA